MVIDVIGFTGCLYHLSQFQMFYNLELNKKIIELNVDFPASRVLIARGHDFLMFPRSKGETVKIFLNQVFVGFNP